MNSIDITSQSNSFCNITNITENLVTSLPNPKFTVFKLNPRNLKISTTMSMIPSFFGNQRTNVFDPFSLDIWDPFQDFPFPDSSSSALSFPARSEISKETSQLANTRIDWKETPEAHIFRADLPGIKKEVKVEIEEGRVLQISGERSREKEEKNDKWHRVERSSGKFLRRFRLPENANIEEVKASMENGVLTVNVPKVEEKKPEVKSIQISG
ncbi:17.8 kDa class I heat shock protein-like isoform X2 [Papaver somniferum]|uniref:17.8 kDa class I heat shock protein-like isoform X1 n=1 Tax=Papaver somniferum TaxID=3469 RepID=UPI000E7054BD|nr:17.8 kDa class I heat shock protein-like isoform X1 [Papaver somniferum]XP_026409201.1 17.8 kDa class I heat shock protein-like isoform X1 [Papaver somniferum]XP_026409202.1 17.8 kDa class I heat shock protein-like isoform X2 [Papaver somniferum]